MHTIRLIALALLLGASLPSHAKPRDAGTWVSLQLAPALIQALTSHPRFKGEAIRLVVFTDDKPAAMSNAFELSLRDRLAAAVFDAPGIRLAAQQGPGANIDCTRDQADYFIGLQLQMLDDDEARISLRTLDLGDYSWVTGLDLEWQGALSAHELRALAEPAADAFFRGQRTAPYRAAESDMLAARLARELGCQSMRQMQGDYKVFVDGDDELAALVASNLSAYHPLQFTTQKAQANAVLSGNAHVVAPELQQYWVTIAPLATDSLLPSLSASAYLESAGAGDLSLVRPDAAIVASAQLVSTDRHVAMRVTTTADAVVFFLNHQVKHGLVRLSDADCRTRSNARVTRARQPLTQALPLSSLMPDAASVPATWSQDPDGDTYLAIAVADSEAAFVLSKHLQKLPQRCTAAARFGLDGAELEAWMREFIARVDDWKPYVDWQAIQVRNVY